MKKIFFTFPLIMTLVFFTSCKNESKEVLELNSNPPKDSESIKVYEEDWVGTWYGENAILHIEDITNSGFSYYIESYSNEKFIDDFRDKDAKFSSSSKALYENGDEGISFTLNESKLTVKTIGRGAGQKYDKVLNAAYERGDGEDPFAESKPNLQNISTEPEQSDDFPTKNTLPKKNPSMPIYSATDYILPDSDSIYYDEYMLNYLPSDTLKYARNEIYARHGRKFDSKDLQDYFNSKHWYNGTIDANKFSEDNLNKFEKENVLVIKNLEDKISKSSQNQPNTVYPTYLDYILPDSDYMYYTEDMLKHFNLNELKYARNEIYARYGRIFDSKDLQDYFNQQSWYNGTIEPNKFSENVLNKYEKANIELIKKLEAKK